jgi:hypothetical protein
VATSLSSGGMCRALRSSAVDGSLHDVKAPAAYPLSRRAMLTLRMISPEISGTGG